MKTLINKEILCTQGDWLEHIYIWYSTWMTYWLPKQFIYTCET